jgi:hypothetical protein
VPDIGECGRRTEEPIDPIRGFVRKASDDVTEPFVVPPE